MATITADIAELSSSLGAQETFGVDSWLYAVYVVELMLATDAASYPNLNSSLAETLHAQDSPSAVVNRVVSVVEAANASDVE